MRTPETADTAALVAALAAQQTPTHNPPAPGRAAPEAHTAALSASMGVAHETVSAPWGDHWADLAARNGITRQEVTDARR
jgi:hypothetical protein